VSLNPKQLRFVAEYLKDHNATQAAIRAGYSAKTAYSQGQRLLKHVEVKARVGKGMGKLMSNLEITAERVLKERARLAFFDVRKLLDATGRPLSIHQLDDDTAAAVAGIDVANIGNAEVGEGEVLKIKMADKNASLTALEKHLGLYKDGTGDSVPLHIHLHL
jgi:phage terminase small subunit